MSPLRSFGQDDANDAATRVGAKSNPGPSTPDSKSPIPSKTLTNPVQACSETSIASVGLGNVLISTLAERAKAAEQALQASRDSTRRETEKAKAAENRAAAADQAAKECKARADLAERLFRAERTANAREAQRARAAERWLADGARAAAESAEKAAAAAAAAQAGPAAAWSCITAEGPVRYSPADSARLEAALSGRGANVRVMGGAYEVDVAAMTQTNVRTGFQRRVTRAALRAAGPGAAGGPDALPWSAPATALGDGATRRSIPAPRPDDPDSRELLEYNFAFAQFHRLLSAGRGAAAGLAVTQVDVYDSPGTRRAFDAERARMLAAGRAAGETWVFHGTRASNVEAIMVGGFKARRGTHAWQKFALRIMMAQGRGPNPGRS